MRAARPHHVVLYGHASVALATPAVFRAVAFCYHCCVDMNVRDVPDPVHAILAGRAAARGMSLRAYVVEVLTAHVALPTVGEWLAEVESLPPASSTDSAVAALVAERDERDEQLAHGSRGGAGRAS